MSFEELGLGPEVLRAVADAGYSEPTPIQKQAIPHVLMGRDILGCAQTGTGKTASFTLPMIDILANGRARARMPRSLIITPTRELATQISENFETYGKYHKLTMALIIGGVSFDEQIAKLDRGVDVLIATPGRLLDHFERGRILLNDIKVLVIDEADRMMDMGFIPDVERIVGLLPRIRQTLFFSATIPPEILRVADKFLMNPKQISVTPEVRAAESVSQGLVVIAEREKREVLRKLIRSEDVVNALIFCNRKKDVDILYRSLKKHGFNVNALHGDMPQPVRLETLETFKSGATTLLVASDVAARGLDLPKVSHVFNFDVPSHAEDYVHRIGRTGRAGREGRALMLATPEDSKYLAAVVAFIGNEIPKFSVAGFAAQEMEPAEEKRRPRGRRSSKMTGAGASGADRKTSDRKTPERETPERMPVPAKAKEGSNRRRRRPSHGEAEPATQERTVGMGSHIPAFMMRSTRET